MTVQAPSSIKLRNALGVAPSERGDVCQFRAVHGAGRAAGDDVRGQRMAAEQCGVRILVGRGMGAGGLRAESCFRQHPLFQPWSAGRGGGGAGVDCAPGPAGRPYGVRVRGEAAGRGVRGAGGVPGVADDARSAGRLALCVPRGSGRRRQPSADDGRGQRNGGRAGRAVGGGADLLGRAQLRRRAAAAGDDGDHRGAGCSHQAGADPAASAAVDRSLADGRANTRRPAGV